MLNYYYNKETGVHTEGVRVMKKAELKQRVQKKIDELGTLFNKEVFAPSGALLGKITLMDFRPHSVTLAFAGNHLTVGTSCRNPEKAVEDFYNDNKF